MPLSPGTRLGQYEVLEAIGAGGMGEVYRARDTKLGRDVAIKVLPEELSQDKERLDRFEREARLLAKLNHPNIATLYGFEESDGQPFLIMELVEGETLAEYIARGPIPLDEALAFFIQIADGLEAAHDKGIVHRDLKPANIKIGLDGKIKILDFGLAKAFTREEDVATGSSQSPTLTRGTRLRQGFGEAGTQLGAILGTASYMSPEQARGKSIDKRTDLWAFGCCLYEALTGRKVFSEETVTDTISSVVRAEPDWNNVSDLPVRIQTLLRRCLRKNSEKRLRDIGDARLELEDALDEPIPESVAASSATPTAGRWTFAIGLIFAALSVTLFFARQSEIPERRPVRRFTSVELVHQNQPGSTLALSRDGSTMVRVAFARGQDTGDDAALYVRRLDEAEAYRLDGTERAESPFFSPDGQWVGYAADNRLYKVPIRGARPILLCVLEGFFHGAHWSIDGNIYLGAGARLIKVSAEGGEPITLAENDSPSRVGFGRPSSLPGDDALLITTWSETAGESIGVFSLASGTTELLVEDGISPQFLPTGHVVFTRSGVLFAAKLDRKRKDLFVSVAPVPVTDKTVSGGWGSNFDVSDEGTLVYHTQNPGADTLVWVDRAGRETPLIDEPARYYNPRLSAEGSRLAFVTWTDNVIDVWTADLERGAKTRLTFGGSASPLWSSDGASIFHTAGVDATLQVFASPADGGGSPEQVTHGARSAPSSVSPDGKEVFLRQMGQGWDIGVVRLDGERERRALIASEFDEHTPAISPDGGWLAYVSNETGRYEVYVTRYPELGSRWTVSPNGGTEPLWSRDGKELFFRSGSKMMSVSVEANPSTIELGSAEVLFDVPYQRDTIGRGYDVSSDGRFVMIKEGDNAAEGRVEVVLNWFQELDRLVPEDR